jgi:hypothetical protein
MAKGCIDDVIKYWKDNNIPISTDYMKHRISKAYAKVITDNPTMSNIELLDTVKKTLAQEIELEVRQNQRERLFSYLKRLELKGFMEPFDKDIGAGIQALIEGSAKSIEGARDSIDYRGKALHGEYLSLLQKEFKKAGVDIKELTTKSEDIQLELAKALRDVDNYQGQEWIKKAATVIKDVEHRMNDQINKLGGFIKEIPDYITKQKYDRTKISKVSQDDFVEFVLGKPQAILNPLTDEVEIKFPNSKLDIDRTFVGGDTPTDVMKQIYLDVITGRHHAVQFGQSQVFGRNIGGTRERVLHFKSAEDWFDFNKKFGSGKVIDNVLGRIEMDSKKIAIMEKLGPNPEYTLNGLMEDLRYRFKDDVDVVKKQLESGAIDKYKRMLETLLGYDRVAANVSVARLGNAARAVEATTKLGFAVFSSFSDVAGEALSAKNSGGTFLKGIYDGIMDTVRLMSKKERVEWAETMGLALDTMTGDIHSRFSVGDGMEGFTERMLNTFYKYNLLSNWTESHKLGTAVIWLKNIPKYFDKSFGDIDPDLRTSLINAGINEKLWNVLRTVPLEEFKGHKLLIPNNIKKLDGNQELIDELDRKVRTMIMDRVESSIVQPGTRERRIMMQGTKPGTVMGELLRFFWQFKSFPLSVTTKILEPQLRRGGGAAAGGLAEYILATTVLGYASIVVKDLIKGKLPRDPTDPKVWMDSMLQGGGLGLYGDFLFSPRSRYGRGILEELAGPVLGGVTSDVYTIFEHIKQGKFEKLPAETIQLLKGHLPYGNFPFIRSGLDYLLLYGIQEKLSPGYLRRMERRMEHEQKQTFILEPSQYAVRY